MDKQLDKLFFIVNKYSGTGHKADFESAVDGVCSAHGAEWVCAYTEAPAHASTLAAEAIAKGFKTIIAVGGDGTVNEVAHALLHTSATMGIIPKGSGNGLARHLGIPLKLKTALECLFTSDVIVMDTCRLNGRLSLNVSGIGFDGHIADLFAMDKKRGFPAYTRLVVNEFMQFPEFEAKITVGGHSTRKKAFVIAIANSSQYGNNAKIAPTASIQDGLLDVSILKKVPPYRLDFIYSFFSGTIDQTAYWETLQVRDAVIELAAPLAFHIDGEPAGKTDRFEIEIVPASLNILTPHGATPTL